MVSTPEGCNYNIPMTSNQSEPTKNPSARKLIPQFLEALDVNSKTALCCLDVAKENFGKIISGNIL